MPGQGAGGTTRSPWYAPPVEEVNAAIRSLASPGPRPRGTGPAPRPGRARVRPDGPAGARPEASWGAGGGRVRVRSQAVRTVPGGRAVEAPREAALALTEQAHEAEEPEALP
ncbi:hypothetical protein CAG99_25165 [Streptomyces marincola]|uniref:Uncharacterized protein n=1 Tax=Streptomyces marincola TaxID=2878388 RepID=A0A1W7D3K7_9ACTN|nr:hypothetical protein CAG99_25165 [Streptomyces marincola]